jgi:hypothetical protein
MKTASWYISQMKHRAGKNTWDSRVDPWDVFNSAASEVVDARPWSFLTTTESVPATAGQDFILMPPDFEALEDAIVDGIGVGGVQLVAPGTIRKHRQRTRTYTGWWFLAIDGTARQASTAVPARVRASLWPIPTTNGSPTIVITYRRRWVDMVESVDDFRVPNLPPQFHRAILLGCRVWTWEYLHPEQPAADRPIFEAELERLWKLDESQQIDFGPMIGGIVDERDEDDFIQIGTITP